MNIFYYENKRIVVSFFVSIMFHSMILVLMGFLTTKAIEKRKVIENVDFIDPTVVVPQEKPKSLLEFIRKILPIKEEEKPKEVEKKLLVDKEEPFIRRERATLQFDKLKEISSTNPVQLDKERVKDKTKEFMEIEKRMNDKGELKKKAESSLKLDNEVGLKREVKVKDISNKSREKLEEERIRNLTPQDLLIDKKEPPKVQKVESIGTDNLEIKLKSEEQLKLNVKDVSLSKIKEQPGSEKTTLKLEEKSIKDVIVPKKISNVNPNIAESTMIDVDRKDELKKVEKNESLALKEKVEKNIKEISKVLSKSASMEFSGPLKDRERIIIYMPEYPEDMKEKGIETDVSIKFFVTPAGYVSDKITIEKTSGYSELDKLVMSVIKQWQFKPLPKNVSQEYQWGIVIFRFKLQ